MGNTPSYAAIVAHKDVKKYQTDFPLLSFDSVPKLKPRARHGKKGQPNGDPESIRFGFKCVPFESTQRNSSPCSCDNYRDNYTHSDVPLHNVHRKHCSQLLQRLKDNSPPRSPPFE